MIFTLNRNNINSIFTKGGAKMKKYKLLIASLSFLFVLSSCNLFPDYSTTSSDTNITSTDDLTTTDDDSTITTGDTSSVTTNDTSSNDTSNSDTTSGDEDTTPINNIDGQLDPNLIEEHLTYLAGPEIGGRASGSATNLEACHYVSNYFEDIGLKPYSEDGSYLQPYIQDHTRIFKQYFSFEMSNVAKTTSQKYRYSYDFSFFYGRTSSNTWFYSPRAFSANAPLIQYVGGESSNYKNRVVLVDELTINLLNNLKAADALGIIIKDQGTTYPQIEFGQGDMFDETDFLLLWAKEATYTNLISKINNNINQLSMSYEMDIEQKEVNNVIGILDVGAKQNIIVSAHLDHLGRFDEEEGGYYAGALDNASGLSSILELARVYKENESKLTKNVIFIAYNGEEAGLFGSRYYSTNMVGDKANTRGSFNLDMIGGSAAYPLEIYGNYGSATKLLTSTLEQYDISNYQILGNYAVTDHYWLAAMRIVSISFVHFDDRYYHTPLDTVDKIDFDVLVNQVEMIATFMLTLFNK